MNYCNMKEPSVNLKKDAKGNFVIPGNLKVNGVVGIRTDPNPKDGLVINGAGNIINSIETVGAGIYCDKTFRVTGASQFDGEVSMEKSLRVTNEMKAKDVIGTKRVGFNNGRHAIYLENNNEINQYSNGKLSNLHLGYRAPVHLGYTGQDVFINKVKVDSKTVGGLGIDMESIEICQIANNLTKNGKLVVPGGLKLKVD